MDDLDAPCTCSFCTLFGKSQEVELPPCDTTFLVPMRHIDDETLNTLVDWDCAENLPQSLALQFPSRLIPLKTTGDGNCLLHAVSRALFGVERYYDLLRKRMTEELQAHEEWYCRVAGSQFGPEDWKRIVDNARRSGAYLEFMHIFALSHVIARPILIYANDVDMEKFGQGESGVAATFVPARLGRAACRHRPVVLAWQSRAKNHYVPIVGLADRELITWPELAPAFPHALPSDETHTDYLHTDAPVIEPPLIRKIEEQQRERQKREELVRLVSRAFTAPSPRGTGKGKKVDNGEDEAEMEVEERDDTRQDQQDALRQLTQFLKAQREEEAREEEAQRKRIREAMEKLRRDREAQLKRDLAKRPRRGPQEKHEWRGHLWDLKCMVDLGDEVPRVIAWNYRDHLPGVVDAFLEEHGFGKEKHNMLLQLLAQRTIRFIMENLAEREYGIEDADEGEQAADGTASTKKKPPTSGDVSAEPVLKAKEVAPSGPPPPPICQHVPKRRGAPVLYTQGQLDGIHKKLLQFNDELARDSRTSHLSASTAELGLVASIVDSLRSGAASASAAAAVSFSDAECRLMARLLADWPAAKLFPVLDILRLLALYKSAAERLAAVQASDARFLEALVTRLAPLADNPQANSMIALKFFANTFAQPALEEGVAARHAVRVLEALAPLAASRDARIRLPVANVVLNFSSILCDAETMTPGKQAGLSLITRLLEDEGDAETLYPLLVALGTLMYGDRESTTFAKGTALAQHVKRHLASTNTKIAEVARDLDALLQHAW